MQRWRNTVRKYNSPEGIDRRRELKLTTRHSRLACLLFSSLTLSGLLLMTSATQPASARHHLRRQIHPREEAAQQEPTQEEQPAQEQGTDESATNSSSNDAGSTTSTNTDSSASSEEGEQSESRLKNLLGRGQVHGNDLANAKALANIMFNVAEIFLILFIFGSLSGGGLLGGLLICAIVWHVGKMFRGGRKPAIG